MKIICSCCGEKYQDAQDNWRFCPVCGMKFHEKTEKTLEEKISSCIPENYEVRICPHCHKQTRIIPRGMYAHCEYCGWLL